jgi:hypothetical protein
MAGAGHHGHCRIDATITGTPVGGCSTAVDVPALAEAFVLVCLG